MLKELIWAELRQRSPTSSKANSQIQEEKAHSCDDKEKRQSNQKENKAVEERKNDAIREENNNVIREKRT